MCERKQIEHVSMSLTTILHSSRTKPIRPSQPRDMTAVGQMQVVRPCFSYLLRPFFSFSSELLIRAVLV